MRRAARIDANQTQIVSALLGAGAMVQSLAGVGNGVPDLLVGINGRLALFEVKDGSKPPSKRERTPAQVLWHQKWDGYPICMVDSVATALRHLRVIQS